MHPERMKMLRKTAKDIVFILLLISIVMSWVAAIFEVAIHANGVGIPIQVVSIMVSLSIMLLGFSLLMILMVDIRRFLEWRNRGYN